MNPPYTITGFTDTSLEELVLKIQTWCLINPKQKIITITHTTAPYQTEDYRGKHKFHLLQFTAIVVSQENISPQEAAFKYS